MRFFSIITIVSALLLLISKPFDQKAPSARKEIPALVEAQHRDFKDSFQHPQNANFAWAVMTGQKHGISSHVIQDLKILELNFLFSPGGIHLSAFLFLFFFLIKRITTKKIFKLLQFGILIWAMFLPYLAIKRIILLRLLILLQRKLNSRILIEVNFIIVFFIAFILGHFSESPISFILSFLFIGTFISLRDEPRFILILGLFSSHLLIAFFSGAEVSFLSLLISIPTMTIFSFFLPFIFIYLFTFKLITFNWVECLIRGFILFTHWEAKLVQGTQMSASLFLILAVWIILLKKNKKIIIFLLLLHGNFAQSPTIFMQVNAPGLIVKARLNDVSNWI